MGLFSKKADGDDVSISSKKSGMFRRNKEPEVNPYAVSAPPTAYEQAKSSLPTGPRPGGGLPSGPAPPYSSPAMSSSTYGSEKFGSQAGYNRYGGDSNANAYGNPETSRSGGYGGLGAADDSNKDSLFGGASKRYVPPQNGNTNGRSGQPAPTRSYGGANDDPNKSALLNGAPDRYATAQSGRYGQAGGQAGNDGDEYGGYGDHRELTQEELEEQEVEADKAEIKRLKREGVETTNRSAAIAAQTLEVANGTLARLGAQGDRLHNTEKNLDIATNHSKVAEERTKKLKSMNRSMFAVHVGNPFTSTRKEAQRDAQILEKHRMERDQRQATRADQYAANQRLEETFKDLSVGNGPASYRGPSAAEKSKYAFEEDSEDDENEEAINNNVEVISRAVGQLNKVAQAIGTEVDSQNAVIDRIGGKTDIVDDKVRLNREKLSRIH